ncbi:MAG: hypothetical protein GY929_17440 [Actinomycetia bacterium]|nr:hypothetical protein [Actinomycetes bacterium]
MGPGVGRDDKGRRRIGSIAVASVVVALILGLALVTIGRRSVGSDDAQAPLAADAPLSSTVTVSAIPAPPPPDPAVPGPVEVDLRQELASPRATPTAEPSEGPTVVVEPVGPVGCPPGEQVAFCEMVAFVEQETGRPFRAFPTIELAADEEFEARLLADLHESREDIDRDGHLLAALGLLDPSDDLYTSMRSLLGVGVVGFYAPETDELVVRGNTVTPYVAETVAHELVHALDDQWYGLHRPSYEERDDEVGFGFAALVEGHALQIQDRWREAQPAEVRLDASSEQLAYVSDIDVSRFPAMALRLISAPYLHGPEFVDALDGAGVGLAESFAAPAVSSEQVLHPHRYLSGERPVAVADPPIDGDEVGQGTIGEFLLKQVLAVHLGDDRRAAGAADGWAGDRYRTWTEADGARCVRFDLVADSNGDHLELASAFGALAAADPAWVVDDFGTSLRVTACR